MLTPVESPSLAGAVVGIGTDLVEIERVKSAIEHHGDSFLQRVFTQAERDHCAALGSPWASYAARFAAKEAVSKAFGTGIGADLNLTSIGVVSDKHGAPTIVLDEKGSQLLRTRGGKHIHISLTHTATLAQAFAVISK